MHSCQFASETAQNKSFTNSTKNGKVFIQITLASFTTMTKLCSTSETRRVYYTAPSSKFMNYTRYWAKVPSAKCIERILSQPEK